MSHFSPPGGDVSFLGGGLECRLSLKTARAIRRMSPRRRAIVQAAQRAIARDILLRCIHLGLSHNGGLGLHDAGWLYGGFPDVHYHGEVWLRIEITRSPVSLLVTEIGFVGHA